MVKCDNSKEKTVQKMYMSSRIQDYILENIALVRQTI